MFVRLLQRLFVYYNVCSSTAMFVRLLATFIRLLRRLFAHCNIYLLTATFIRPLQHSSTHYRCDVTLMQYRIQVVDVQSSTLTQWSPCMQGALKLSHRPYRRGTTPPRRPWQTAPTATAPPHPKIPMLSRVMMHLVHYTDNSCA